MDIFPLSRAQVTYPYNLFYLTYHSCSNSSSLIIILLLQSNRA